MSFSRCSGYFSKSGQIVGASLFAAPKQRNSEHEKADIKAGRIPGVYRKKPTKLRQKDRNARSTLKFTKVKPKQHGTKQVDIANPSLGYQNHFGIDRARGLIRQWIVNDAGRLEGVILLGGPLDKNNTDAAVWADSTYRSKVNETFLAANGFTSKTHRLKLPNAATVRSIPSLFTPICPIRADVKHVRTTQPILAVTAESASSHRCQSAQN